ncbi:MAG TPA: KEOPS complex subunit Pcc1 [Methanoregula sp.]|nr:KEOPS complex subunit Pcc1 [Methanoregula sp.]
MMKIEGSLSTIHPRAGCVAAALRPDNLPGMTTHAEGDRVITTMEGTQLRSVIASVDDYLMNLAIAEDACSVAPREQHIPVDQETTALQSQR